MSVEIYTNLTQMNKWGVFLARRSVQHLVFIGLSFECLTLFQQDFNYFMKVSFIGGENKIIQGKSPTVLTRCFR